MATTATAALEASVASPVKVALAAPTTAAVLGSVPKPFVIAVDSMPPGGWLQETQVFGTLFIALIAAGIAGTIQWRQMQIARGALKTATTKLTLDLFERRLAIFDAAKALIHDDYPDEMDDIDAVRELRDRLQGARWLLNQQAATVVIAFGKEAYDRHREEEPDLSTLTLAEKSALRRKTNRERRERVTRDMRKLRELFDRFLSIDH